LVGAGNASVPVSFDAWKAGHVAPSHHEVPVVVPKPGPKREPVSARLKGELIHPSRNGVLAGLRFSPDGRRIIGGDYPGGVVVLWDVASGRDVTTIETGYGYRASLEYFFLSPDWRELFVSRGTRKVEQVEKDGKRLRRWTCDGDVRTWDLATGRLLHTYKHDPPRDIRLMELAPDGRRFVTWEEVSGTSEGSPKSAASLWDVQTGRYQALPDDLQVYGQFSADGRALAVVAVGSDRYARTVKLLDTATGRERLSIPITDGNARVFTRALSPDGRLLVGTGQVFEKANKADGGRAWLKLWDTTTGREVASLDVGPNDAVGNVSFSPDGRALAAVNWRGAAEAVPHRRGGREANSDGRPGGQPEGGAADRHGASLPAGQPVVGGHHAGDPGPARRRPSRGGSGAGACLADRRGGGRSAGDTDSPAGLPPRSVLQPGRQDARHGRPWPGAALGPDCPPARDQVGPHDQFNTPRSGERGYSLVAAFARTRASPAACTSLRHGTQSRGLIRSRRSWRSPDERPGPAYP
jgi:hypothetical protein